MYSNCAELAHVVRSRQTSNEGCYTRIGVWRSFGGYKPVCRVFWPNMVKIAL